MHQEFRRTGSSIRRVSLRVRIMLWVVGILAAIQITLGVVYMLYQRSELRQFFNDRLEMRAAGVAKAIKPALSELDDERLIEVSREELGRAFLDNFTVEVVRDDGTLIASTVRPDRGLRQHFLWGPGRGPDSDAVQYVSSAAEDPELQMQMIRRPLGFVNDEGYSAILAIDVAYRRSLSTMMSRMLAVAIPLGLITAVVCGWIVGGVAVAPLESLREVARKLTPESIRERIESKDSVPEIRQLREELDLARSRIERAFAAQARFMSNVSHELKTPIAVLMTESQTLSKEQLPEEAQVFLRLVQEEMRRLGRMIDSFLTLTRVQDGKSTTVSRRVYVSDLIVDSVGHCDSMAQQHGVRLELRLPDEESGISLSLRGDPDLLRTMLDNLIHNAVRFTPEGRAVCVAADSVGRGVNIRVRDFGPGIPAGMIDRVFDRFAQAESERRQGRGHGLGLEIAQGIAELHSGKIAVRNCDVGCEFSIWLPLEESAAERLPDEPVAHAGEMNFITRSPQA